MHGDAIHYVRALAMQAEMLGRLGLYGKAQEIHEQLKVVYNPEEHSSGICDAYGSDPAAQSFCMSALWFLQEGNTCAALSTCENAFIELFPEMEKRNVYNNFCMIYPLLWILKDNKRSSEARDHFMRFVIEPYEEYIGEGGSTLCFPVFAPIMMLLNLVLDGDSKIVSQSMEWALVEKNLRFGAFLNRTLGKYGRCADSISAEICLVLSQRTVDRNSQHYLIQTSLGIAKDLESLTDSMRMRIAGQECREVRAKAMEVGKKLHILQ